MEKDINSKIIDILKSCSEFITSADLSNELGVSTKTISRKIRSLNNQFKQPIIISKKGRGYKLDTTAYLKNINQNMNNDSSAVLRQNNILSALLFKSPGAIKISDLMNRFYVSESILHSDQKAISSKITKWHLKLGGKNRALRIIGSERNIRNALTENVLHINTAIDIESLKTTVDDNNRKDFNFALSQVELALRSLNGTLPYPYNINFFAHIFILLSRARNYKSVNQSIQTDSEIDREIKQNPEVFSVCAKIIGNISSYLNINPNSLNNETYYLFQYLLTSRFNTFDGIVLNDRKLAEQITDFYILSVSQTLHYSFDKTISEELVNHILSMISRLKMNISLPNALLKDIKLEYSSVFNATAEASREIDKKFDLPIIPEDEIGFISLYFIKYYEESQTQQTVKTYIVCTTGIGTSEIISTKIQKKFPEIEIIGLGSTINIKNVLRESPKIDLIISTVPIKDSELCSIPVELVSAFFTNQDEERIRKVVDIIQDEKSKD